MVQRVLDVVDHPVVLAVEHLVDRAQCDVLVAATIAADEVEIEQFVVVLTGRNGIQAAAGDVVGIGRVGRRRAVGDVVEERCVDVPGVGGHGHRSREVALDEPTGRDVLRQTVRAGDEVAVRVGGEHRDVVDIEVDQLQTELGRGLLLDHRPVGHAAVLRGQELAGS